jgi:hypothetical protein
MQINPNEIPTWDMFLRPLLELAQEALHDQCREKEEIPTA